MTEWITGSIVLASILAVLYVYGLPVAGSLWRRYVRARNRRREISRLMRVFALPRALFK